MPLQVINGTVMGYGAWSTMSVLTPSLTLVIFILGVICAVFESSPVFMHLTKFIHSLGMTLKHLLEVFCTIVVYLTFLSYFLVYGKQHKIEVNNS